MFVISRTLRSLLGVRSANHGFVGRILSGWQLAPIVSIASGIAINVTSGRDNSLTSIGLDRPNYVGGSLYANATDPRFFLNSAAFQQNANGTFGNLGRDVVHGPGRVNFDAALSRSFMLTERWRLEARWEAFNAINHVNYNNPTTALNSANFGRILGAADPRIMQVSMKLHF